jgi:hypothetical protein
MYIENYQIRKIIQIRIKGENNEIHTPWRNNIQQRYYRS